MAYVKREGCAAVARSETIEGARAAIAALKRPNTDAQWAEPVLCKQCGWFHFVEIDPPADGPLPFGFVKRQAVFYNVPTEAAEAFHEQRRSAKRRGIPFLFSLPDWWAWWQIDGRWERRGLGRDALVMARRGDAGAYSPENVYCATHSENGRDVGPSGGRIAAREAIRKLAGTGALRRLK